jgi:O-acetyl-ADP-ribose deacetylase (regulator of RNase III)
LAAEHDLASIAFPAISTGVYGYPALEAGRIAIGAVAAFLRDYELPNEVRLVFFSSHQANLILTDQTILSSLN